MSHSFPKVFFVPLLELNVPSPLVFCLVLQRVSKSSECHLWELLRPRMRLEFREIHLEFCGNPSIDRPSSGLCDFAGFCVAAQDDVLLLTTELPLGEFLFSKSAQHLLSGLDSVAVASPNVD